MPKVKVKIKILQKKLSKLHQDCFWYEGDIALLTYKNREALVVAAGDIRIINKDGEMVHDGNKWRGPGFPEFKKMCPQNDKDLNKLEKLGYRYDMNNWFEWLHKFKGDDSWECILGDVAYEYDDAIECAKYFIKDESWWKELEVRCKTR